MRISAQALTQIQEQIQLKDRAAFALGVALVEYELEKLRITDRATDLSLNERYVRLGAVQDEFDSYRSTHMKVVVRANAAQKAFGEAALSALGLASETRNFTIDPKTGEVLELIAGAYVPMPEAA